MTSVAKKSSIALFLTEILRKALQEEGANEELFTFLTERPCEHQILHKCVEFLPEKQLTKLYFFSISTSKIIFMYLISGSSENITLMAGICLGVL